MTAQERPELRALGEALGIAPGYHDVAGRWHDTSDATREALAAAMGHEASSEAAASASRRRALDEDGALASARPQAEAGAASRCVTREELLGTERVFGLIANLHALRSRRDGGIGDLRGVADLCAWAGREGADFVGLSPLHATRGVGFDVSPYTPTSRLYRSELHASAVIPLGADPRPGAALAEKTPRREPEGRGAVRYDEVKAAKRAALRAAWDARTPEDDRELQRFRAREGEDLEGFATFTALDETQREEGLFDWHRWPRALRDPRGEAVRAFARENAHVIGFHAWVQLELDRQLARAADVARGAGMRIGLYQDLAVGTAGWGSETWLYPGLFAEAASIGCPPDPLGPEGQDWGLPPVNPRRLLATDLAYWRKLLRAAMAHAGALRIDHAMGLVRQFWIPCGRPASEGAYVVYPAERMLGVLAEESRRAGALVVGEDLGTVPEGFAATLERWGILSTRVLPFERDASGTFLAAAAHSSRALLVASTHDLPPLWGWWRGADLEVRRSLGLLGSDEDLAAAQQRRLSDRARLVRRLHAEGLVPTSWEPTSAAELAHAVHAFLCSTPAPLVGLTLEDLCGETAPLNVPGVTQDRYPSWTLRLSVDVEDLPAHAGVRRALAGAAARRRASS